MLAIYLNKRLLQDYAIIIQASLITELIGALIKSRLALIFYSMASYMRDAIQGRLYLEGLCSLPM